MACFRRRDSLKLALLLAPASCFVQAGRAGAAPLNAIRCGGTGSVTELIAQLGGMFSKTSKGVPVEVIPGLGSSGGISAAADGVVHLAISGRLLKPEEKALGLRVVGALRTPFVLLTSRQNPQGMSCLDIARIYSDVGPVWEDGSPLNIILRPSSESDNALIASLFDGIGASIDKARKRPDVPVAATDQDNLDLAESMRGSLAASTMVQALTENRNLWPIPIDGVMPGLDAMANGTYPLAKTMYLVTRGEASADILALMAFMREAGSTAFLARCQAMMLDGVPA